MRQYYSEHYNRDVQVHNLEIKSQKFLFKEKFANPRKFQLSKYSGYTVLQLAKYVSQLLTTDMFL